MNTAEVQARVHSQLLELEVAYATSSVAPIRGQLNSDGAIPPPEALADRCLACGMSASRINNAFARAVSSAERRVQASAAAPLLQRLQRVENQEAASVAAEQVLMSSLHKLQKEYSEMEGQLSLVRAQADNATAAFRAESARAATVRVDPCLDSLFRTRICTLSHFSIICELTYSFQQEAAAADEARHAARDCARRLATAEVEHKKKTDEVQVLMSWILLVFTHYPLCSG